jgi:predicted NBD/HSP70 family sugar kinase
MRFKGQNNQIVKEYNQSVVLKTLWYYSGIPRIEVARKTGLTRATITNLVQELIDVGIIKENGCKLYQDTEIGRKRVAISLNSEMGYVYGINLGTRSINGGIFDCFGKSIFSKEVKIPKEYLSDPQKYIAFSIDFIQLLQEESKISWDNILGIGLAIPGIIERKSGICKYSANLGWRDVPVLSSIQKVFKKTILCENDARALTMAEYLFGDAKNLRNFICVKLGNGIGVGIFMNGELLYGENYGIGELGHITVPNNPRVCRCGKVGCLETIAAAEGIVRRSLETFSKTGKELPLRKSRDEITAKDIVDLAKKGNNIATEIIRETGEILGWAISDLINLFGIQHIIVGGGLSHADDLLINPLLDSIKSNTLPVLAQNLSIQTSRLPLYGEALGAAGLLFQGLFEKPSMLIAILSSNKRGGSLSETPLTNVGGGIKYR